MIPSLPHPLLDAAAFVTLLPSPLSAYATPPWLLGLLSPDAPGPAPRTEEIRVAVRELLRHGGYRPTGRGKPASEYLVRAASEGTLGSINLLVDLCNAVSLHSGLPISVVDLELTRPPLRIVIPEEDDAEYVFNGSGQTIRTKGLLCLADAEGPTANGVKDSQRTKTRDATRRALSIVWGTHAAEGHCARVVAYYRELTERALLTVADVDASLI